MDFVKLYITVFLSAGGSFKHSNSIEHNTFWQHPQPPNVTSRIIKFLGAYTQLLPYWPTPTFWRTKTTGPAHGHTSHRNSGTGPPLRALSSETSFVSNIHFVRPEDLDLTLE